MFVVFFFFKQKTAYELRISDWSSDVCSSDLDRPLPEHLPRLAIFRMVRSNKYRVRLSSPSIWFPSRSRLRQKRPEGCAYPLGRRFLLCLHLPDVQHRQKSRGSVPPHRKIHELFPHGTDRKSKRLNSSH